MKSFGRIIGIDVGTRRIGLARTDPLRTSVNPVGTYAPAEIFDQIEKQQKDYPILAFVVGWPLSTGGEHTEATRMVERFIKKLNKRFPDIPVHTIDERYSSKEAVQTMIRSGVPRKKRAEKGRVDQTVAALLLQQFLETENEFK